MTRELQPKKSYTQLKKVLKGLQISDVSVCCCEMTVFHPIVIFCAL